MNTKNTTDYIVNWLYEYANSANIKGFVVGVSGGIDSAVTAALCARTGLPVLCVQMPIHQAENQVNRGLELVEILERKFDLVRSTTVDLTPVFEVFKNEIPKINIPAKDNLSLANSRARLRMTTLFHLAGINNYIVAGTGNKVEDFGVGFFTKYGDGGVDISPIADLMKSEVYKLGAFLEVPSSILKAAPTDGLFGDNRTDEDQLGASYDEFEWAMAQVEREKNANDFSNREKEVFELYTRLHRANLHKMNPIPVCEIPDSIKNS